MRTEHWTRAARALGLAGVLALTACDRSPTEPPTGRVADEAAAAEALAAEAVRASWSELVSAEELHLQTLEAARTGQAPAEAEEALLDAGVFAAEADEALREGRTDLADELTGLMEEAYLAAAVEIRGAALVDEAIAGAEATLDRVDAAVASAPPSDLVRDRVTSARDALDAARDRRGRGDRAGALRFAARASDAVRDLHPEDRATALVEKAHRLLEKALELAGPDPRPEIAAHLANAERACERAREALAEEAWRVAVANARTCGRHAHRVISLLSGGVPDDHLSDRAEAVVEHAAELLARATELAGDEPRPEISDALAEAGALLAEAREALAEEAWREAVGLARRSAAISRKVIRVLSGDGPGDHVHDRVEAMVETAAELLEEARELAGPDVDPAIAERLERAAELVAEAEAELEAGEWRAAFAHARRAARILRHVIARLS